MKVRCIGIEYQSGSFQLVQGVKGHEGDFRIGAQKFHNRGSGWGEFVTGSKLILTVEVDGQNCEIWVDRFFKRNLGRLVESRRRLIKQTMPDFVDIEKAVSERGTEYYVVSQSDLDAWLARYKERAS